MLYFHQSRYFEEISLKTCLKLAIRQIKKSVFAREVIIILFTVVFSFVIFFVSAIQLKLKDYQSLSRFFRNKGLLITSMGLAKSADDHGTVIRDEEELADYLGDTTDILCMEEVWATTVNGESVDTYCYSRNVVDSLDPDMAEGRWFDSSDRNSDRLKVVVSYNNGIIKTGDTIVLKSTMDNELAQEMDVIGILADDQLMFMGDTIREAYCDYRDCFKVFSSKYDKTIKLFLSDEQLSTGAFPYLNFRTGPEKGFQKQMRNVTLISFKDGIGDDEILEKTDKLRELSNIVGYNTLDDIRKGSRTYITQELSTWFPLFAMLLFFVIIALISVNIVMTRKMMGYYAIHYLCGFTWKQNANVSMFASLMEAAFAFVIILIITLSGKTGLTLGIVEAFACLVTAIVIVLVSHLTILGMIGKTSAKEVFGENGQRRLTW